MSLDWEINFLYLLNFSFAVDAVQNVNISFVIVAPDNILSDLIDFFFKLHYNGTG